MNQEMTFTYPIRHNGRVIELVPIKMSQATNESGEYIDAKDIVFAAPEDYPFPTTTITIRSEVLASLSKAER